MDIFLFLEGFSEVFDRKSRLLRGADDNGLLARNHGRDFRDICRDLNRDDYRAVLIGVDKVVRTHIHAADGDVNVECDGMHEGVGRVKGDTIGLAALNPARMGELKLENSRIFKADELRRFTRDVFVARGLPGADATVIANDLVEADLRGLSSHGVSRIPTYCERLRRGLVNPTPNIAVERITPVAASVDGDDGMGFIVAHRAMDEAIEMARGFGLGLTGIKRSTHFGMAALYVLQAIEAEMISLVFTNSSPALPVWGGRSKFLGAAPLAAGAPGGELGPYVLDMAMTVIARGKIRLAAQRGDSIPEGLAIDSEGRPTTDAMEAFTGVCLPFGGHKGAALSMLMEVLAGVFTGAAFAGDVVNPHLDFSAPQNAGHFFMAIKPDLFVSMEEYRDRMDTLVARVKACPRAEGFEEILMPGEPEARERERRIVAGIPLSEDIVKGLAEEAEKAEILPPVAIA